MTTPDSEAGAPAPSTRSTTQTPVGVADDLTAKPEAQAHLVPAELVAQTMREYWHAQLLRIRGGESGMLPVFLALIATGVVFQIISPNHVFLSAGNIVNLFQQSAVFMVLAMAEIFALLLGEIDLSIGFVGPVGGGHRRAARPAQHLELAMVAAIIVALFACGLIGALQGTLISRLRLPSFIVTLAGNLVFNGVLLIILAIGPFSGYPSISGPQPNLRALYDMMWGHVSPLAGWIVLALLVGVLGMSLHLRDTRRRKSGLVAPPPALTYLKIAAMAIVGIVVVAICNVNRAAVGTLEGVPYVIFIVLGVLGLWDLPPTAHPLRPLRLRDRREPRSRATSRHQGGSHSHVGIRAVRGDGVASQDC